MFGAGQVRASEPGSTLITPSVHTDYQSNMLIIILVAVAGILGTVSTAAYLYNRQRKIQKYKLQKAQEAAAMKLNTPATPP